MRIPEDWDSSSYGTHWYTLLRLFLRFKPRRILETGSGLYSTLFFLSFDIDKLVSLENNPKWIRATQDERHEVVRVKGRMCESLPDLSEFDLVFVDDDPVDERAATFVEVCSRAPGLVVLHDSDYLPLHTQMHAMPNYTDLNRLPATTVVHPAKNKEFEEWLDTQS